MKKQDRQGVRTPADVERKYNLGRILSAQGSSPKLELQIQQLSQTLAQFIAKTNIEIEELKNKEETGTTEIETYNVTFYTDDGVVIAAYIIRKGDAVNPPIADVNWVDGEDATITFPYSPTSDTNLYIQESTL
jgi:hypothetical protein